MISCTHSAPPLQQTAARAVAAIVVCTGPLVDNNRIRINNLPNAARLPTMNILRESVAAGGLMSYGPNVSYRLHNDLNRYFFKLSSGNCLLFPSPELWFACAIW
jgi:hypothetical protein